MSHPAYAVACIISGSEHEQGGPFCERIRRKGRADHRLWAGEGHRAGDRGRRRARRRRHRRTDIATGGTRNENEEGLEEVRIGWNGLESLAQEIEKLGRRIHTVVGDVSRAADAERFVAEALSRFGHIDVLVNNQQR